MTARDRLDVLRFTAAAGALALLGVAIVYGSVTSTGFYYDDYHFVRPLSALELRRVWYGSWDPTGIEYVFFRPLTAWWFAARFWLFGLNAPAMHLVTLGGHMLCAVLVAWFLRRAGAGSLIAMLGAWMYAIHPIFPYAQVSWLTNQMHLLESVLLLAALLYWQHVRRRSLIWWAPLLVLAALMFLVKEDGVMLTPALLLIVLLHASPAEPLTWRRASALIAAVALTMAALTAFRYARLGQLGGYAPPTSEMAYRNFWKGLQSALWLWPTRPAWQGVAALVAIGGLLTGALIAWRERPWQRRGRWVLAAGAALLVLLLSDLPPLLRDRSYALLTAQGLASGAVLALSLLGGGVAFWRRDQRPTTLLLTGVCLALSFNLPYVLVSKREQYHLLALAGVFIYAGAAAALTSAAGRRRALATLVCFFLTIPAAVLARQQARDFRPCSPVVLEADEGTSGWWVVPSEIHAWLQRKASECAVSGAAPRLVDLPIVMWNVHGEQFEDGGTFRWSGDHAVILAARLAAAITLALRRPDASATQPVRVRISGDTQAATVVLDSGDWTYATVRLRPGVRSWLRAGYRIDLEVDRWFVPAVVDPRSDDLRRMGAQVKIQMVNGH